MDDYPKRRDQPELIIPPASEGDTTTATLEPAFASQEAAEAGKPAGHELQDKQSPDDGGPAEPVKRTLEHPLEDPKQQLETDQPVPKARVATASGALATTETLKPTEEPPVALDNDERLEAQPLHIDSRDLSSDPPEPEEEAKTGDSDLPAPASEGTEPKTSKDNVGPPPPPDNPDTASEHPEDPEQVKAAVLADCRRDVETQLVHVKELNDAGDFMDISGDVSGILADQAIASAKAGDTATADAKVDFLESLDGMTEEEVVTACFLVGTKHSMGILKERLADEQATAKAYKEAAERENPGTPYNEAASYLAPGDSPMLWRAVVASESEQSPGSADELIKEFGADDAHKLFIYINHGVRAHGNAPEERTSEWDAYIDEKVTEFTTNEQFTPAQIRGYTSSLIERLPTAELRQKVLDRYLGKHADGPLTRGTFDEHMRILQTAFNDPELVTDDNITAAQISMNSYVGALRNDQGRYHMALGQIGWDVTIRDYGGMRPEDVVHDAESKKQSLFLRAFTARNDDLITERSRIETTIDDALGTQAVRRASWGDFASAASYIANIRDENANRATLQACIGMAESQADIDAIKPYEAALASNPRLELHVRVAEALVSQDVDHLFYTANEIADSINPLDKGESLSLSLYLKTIFNRVADTYPDRQEELARQILTSLRGKDAYTASDTFPYSKVLIRTGDPREIRQAYKDASERHGRLSPKIASLWRLAKLLEEDS